MSSRSDNRTFLGPIDRGVGRSLLVSATPILRLCSLREHPISSPELIRSHALPGAHPDGSGCGAVEMVAAGNARTKVIQCPWWHRRDGWKHEHPPRREHHRRGAEDVRGGTGSNRRKADSQPGEGQRPFRGNGVAARSAATTARYRQWGSAVHSLGSGSQTLAENANASVSVHPDVYEELESSGAGMKRGRRDWGTSS